MTAVIAAIGGYKTGGHRPGRYTPVAQLQHDIAHLLRKEFKLARHPAEWLCFRLAGKIELEWRRGRGDAYTLAQFCYIAWKQSLDREFQIVAVE